MMDLSKATPQEIHDYKQQWLKDKATIVCFHSDYHIEAKDWCRRNIERWQWKFYKYTDVYEHSIYFEFEEDAKEFEIFKNKGFKYDTK
jgi:hypothetical protein